LVQDEIVDYLKQNGKQDWQVLPHELWGGFNLELEGNNKDNE